MIDLLVAGNLYFTLPLTLVALAVVGFSIHAVQQIVAGRGVPTSSPKLLFHLGLFAFVFGLVSQAISLYQMMNVIEAVGGVSPAIVAGGLKVSFIVPLFGVGIFAVALLVRFLLEVWMHRAELANA